MSGKLHGRSSPPLRAGASTVVGGDVRPARPRGAADRVPRSHAQTRRTLRLVLAFLAAGVVTGPFTGGWWLTLHLVLAGGVVLAISGVSLMLTVTWSAAPAPPDRWVTAQRWAIAAGAVGVAVGRADPGAPRALVAAGAVAYLAGLVGLAVLLVVTVRRGVERRFDPAVGAYVLAVVAGVAAASLGGWMALTAVTPALRDAHVAANLLGLVGLTVVGTLPYFAGTVVRARMSPRATRGRLLAATAWQASAVTLCAVALAGGWRPWATVPLVGVALGIVAVLALLPRPTRRQLRWAGPRVVALWLACGWWVLAVGLAAVRTATDRPAFTSQVLALLVVAAYGQLLWASLSYLLPMLRGGGHERLSDGFATTRSWAGLFAVNLAGVALVAGTDPVALAAGSVWVFDAAWRGARVGIARHHRPTEV